MASKSIITDDLETCFICSDRKQHMHHVLYGKNRKQADRFGLTIPVCMKCHEYLHKNPNSGWDLVLKQQAQTAFLIEYPDLNWMDYFSKNYL